MSVAVERYIGYFLDVTSQAKTNGTLDWDRLDAFESPKFEKNPAYKQLQALGFVGGQHDVKQNNTIFLLQDGMNGLYAYLVYMEDHVWDDMNVYEKEDSDYATMINRVLKKHIVISSEIQDKLYQCAQLMFPNDKELLDTDIEYRVFSHYC